MIIYMRHADDAEKKPHYKHDTRISSKGMEATKKIAKELVDKYGYPSKIYFSPFRRCTETVMVLLNELFLIKTGKLTNYCLKCYDNTKNDIKLIADNDIARYFSWSERMRPSVSSRTLKFNVPMNEEKCDVEKRIDNHIEAIKNESDNGIIWCITHAIIYKKIAKKLDIETPDHIGFLDHYVYEKIDNGTI